MSKNWVWRSSAASVANKKLSILAVAETIIVCIAYWEFAIQWLLLVGAFVAPFLLMRSAKSKKLGQRWLRSYWKSNNQRWEEFSVIKKLGLIGLTTGAAGALAALAILELLPILASWLRSMLGGPDASWLRAMLAALEPPAIVESWLRSMLAGILGVLGAGILFLTIECKLQFEDSPPRTFFEIFTGAISSIVICAAIADDFSAGISAGSCALLLSAIGFRARSARGPKGLAGTQPVTFSIVFFAIPYMLAVFLRTVAIRVVATLRHLAEGLKDFPDNWAETCWRMDLCFPAQILPEAHDVSAHLTVQGLIAALKQSHIWREKLIYGFSIALYWVPANFYRWALKSTLWAWWPLLFFLKPVFAGMSDDRRENRIRLTSSWSGKFALALFALYVLLYLAWVLNVPVIRQLMGSLNRDLQGTIESVNSSINVPPLGVIWWGLLVASAVVLLLFTCASRINILYKEDLDAGRVPLLSRENQHALSELSYWQEFWRRALVFTLIQTFWWFSLFLVHLNDPEFMQVRIPERIW